jgi:hypothetical protein
LNFFFTILSFVEICNNALAYDGGIYYTRE